MIYLVIIIKHRKVFLEKCISIKKINKSNFLVQGRVAIYFTDKIIILNLQYVFCFNKICKRFVISSAYVQFNSSVRQVAYTH